MFQKDDILKELQEISPGLIPFQHINVFTVPEGYFDNAAGIFLNEALLHSDIAAGLMGDMMEVPAGYFDSFAEVMLAKAKGITLTAADEIKEISPALSATGNDNVSTVPATYFRDLPEIMLARVQPAKVVRMTPVRSFAKYAAAAVITGIVGLSLFTVFNEKDTSTKLPAIASIMADANNIVRTNSFDKVLSTVSDEEIISYLERTGDDVDAALVASAIDVKELPAAEDYIIDDNTLDEFLDELNIENTN